jgi:hypothetical protein
VFLSKLASVSRIGRGCEYILSGGRELTRSLLRSDGDGFLAGKEALHFFLLFF